MIGKLFPKVMSHIMAEFRGLVQKLAKSDLDTFSKLFRAKRKYAYLAIPNLCPNSQLDLKDRLYVLIFESIERDTLTSASNHR